VTSPQPRRPARPRLPKLTAPTREQWSDGRLIAIAVTVALIAGGGVAALVLSGGSDTPKPAAAGAARGTPAPAATAAPTSTRPKPDAGLERQVRTLDGLMKVSMEGRAAAVKGETKAAMPTARSCSRTCRGCAPRPPTDG
jgi:hypothetical protein